MLKAIVLKLEMFDISKKQKREEKQKLIQTLLIIGGIVGGVRDDQFMLGVFLIGALLYFLIVTDKRIYNDGKKLKDKIFLVALLVAAGFSGTVTGLFTKIQATSTEIFYFALIEVIVLYAILMYSVFRALYT